MPNRICRSSWRIRGTADRAEQIQTRNALVRAISCMYLVQGWSSKRASQLPYTLSDECNL